MSTRDLPPDTAAEAYDSPPPATREAFDALRAQVRAAEQRHDAEVRAAALREAAESIRFDAALRDAEEETDLAAYGRELADLIDPSTEEPTT